MDLIIDFYKELDTLNLIIFWGIIIVIILLLIFSFILINKNKKLKKIVEQKNKYEEELPIKKEELEKEQHDKKINEREPEISKTLPEQEETNISQENGSKVIETEKDFIAEEHVSEYRKDVIPITTTTPISEDKEEKKYYHMNTAKTIEIPNKPYQRNVLREMSLSQTSPIGINRPSQKEDKKIEMVKDLEESLNNEEIQTSINRESNVAKDSINQANTQIKKELSNIENNSYRKTEIQLESLPQGKEYNEIEELIKEDKITSEEKIQTNILENYKELPTVSDNRKEKNSSEKYLEEVSKKLAEAEIPDDIERTNYEIKQEEDAIISYKELMEKKDSIQTIDEEEAIISIEELMNRTNSKQEELKNESKLYNLSEEEANDNFIKELKQFRNDL